MASEDMESSLKICIIGAGMGGLTCALALAKQGFTQIHVFESASNLGFVGAGIQLAPNMSRILDRLGVWSDIEREAVLCKETSIRDGATDQELAHVELGGVKALYGYAHMVGHRASLAGALFEGCKRESGIKFHFSTSVNEVLQWTPSVKFIAEPREGESYEVGCDVLLAADGVKSATRMAMLKALKIEAPIVDTNQAAYRILLTKEQLESTRDPKLLALIDSQRVTRWIGARRHIIAYPICNNTIYNISTTQPDDNFAAAPSETYTTKGEKGVMLKVFGDFDPMVLGMLNLVPDGEVCEWKLRVHAPLTTWRMGNVGLVGDACHPTLPHLAQGAAQAIEDAAVLGVLFGKLTDKKPESIEKVLRVYEKVRMERAYMLVELAHQSSLELHLGSGKAKEERDRVFRELREKGVKGGARVPDKWADADVQKTIYGVDIVKVALEEWEKETAPPVNGHVNGNGVVNGNGAVTV